MQVSSSPELQGLVCFPQSLKMLSITTEHRCIKSIVSTVHKNQPQNTLKNTLCNYWHFPLQMKECRSGWTEQCDWEPLGCSVWGLGPVGSTWGQKEELTSSLIWGFGWLHCLHIVFSEGTCNLATITHCEEKKINYLGLHGCMWIQNISGCLRIWNMPNSHAKISLVCSHH